MHIMWYESKMVSETLDSILKALEHTTLPVKFKICLNAQTYLSKPLQGTSEEMFKYFLDHPFFKLKDVEIVKKTDSEPFYNIGDWRREIYDKKAKYTIWGEPDTLVPQDYLYILEKYDNPSPHVLSLSCRKMWDNTWKPLELKSIRNNSNPPQELLQETYINLDQLNKINQSQGDVEIEKISNYKIEGALIALPSNLPGSWIAENHHFIFEDTSLEAYLAYNKIPIYNISTRIKGHNRNHPFKKVNTTSTKNTKIHRLYINAAYKALSDFSSKLKNQ